MKKDIFQIMGTEKKEDKYTFAFKAFLEKKEFRERVGSFFGFADGNYQHLRDSITLETPTKNRRKITPDIVLYSDSQIAVIESKMFSSEGYMQTQDYESAEKDIQKHVNYAAGQNKKRSVTYYYFTLSESSPNSRKFTPVSWAEVYSCALKDMDFEDLALNSLAEAIYQQAVCYQKAIIKAESLQYNCLFDPNTYWVSPFSLFASGQRNRIWNPTTDYVIQNHVVSGSGHGDFTTDLKKPAWHVDNREGHPEDNIHLFIRCEWHKESLGVYLNWENYDPEKHLFDDVVFGYIATKDLHDELKVVVVENKHTYMRQWSQKNAPAQVKLTSKKESVLRILKYEIDCNNMTIGEILEKAKPVIDYYEKEIESVLNKIVLRDGYFRYC